MFDVKEILLRRKENSQKKVYPEQRIGDENGNVMLVYRDGTVLELTFQKMYPGFARVEFEQSAYVATQIAAFGEASSPEQRRENQEKLYSAGQRFYNSRNTAARLNEEFFEGLAERAYQEGINSGQPAINLNYSFG